MKYKPFLRWIPAFLLMLGIFVLSSIPSNSMPSFGILDLLVKKGSHMLGYGLLTLAFLYGLNKNDSKVQGVAILLAVLYALTDEWHQSYVPGRFGSFWDVGIDGVGSLLSVFLNRKYSLFDKLKF